MEERGKGRGFWAAETPSVCNAPQSSSSAQHPSSCNHTSPEVGNTGSGQNVLGPRQPPTQPHVSSEGQTTPHKTQGQSMQPAVTKSSREIGGAFAHSGVANLPPASSASFCVTYQGAVPSLLLLLLLILYFIQQDCGHRGQPAPTFLALRKSTQL